MSECCCPAPESTTRPACPSCSVRSAAVDVATLKALLTPPALARLELGGFHFCDQPGCDTVYFGDAGEIFRTADIRVPVWQKEPAGARMFCYCFGENEADMRREIDAEGHTGAIERVRRHIADKRCACEVRNPRGACCLGELSAAVKRLSAASADHPS